MTEKKKKAFLISVYKAPTSVEIAHEHLEELALLAKTYGVEVVGEATCPVRKYDASTFITSGKLEEMLEQARALGAELILLDDEISPSQQRNLEKIAQMEVMDRTEIIIEVFAQRAHSREATLQVQLAKMRYEAPRLKRMWTHLSRQKATGGTGAYLKGEGEKQIEVDRRILKRKIAQLKSEIEEVKAARKTQRQARSRSGTPIFAIVGYTNAGKSTLLNALTDAGIFVEDKLFATLDTTTRKFTLPNNQTVLLIDTVGFIRKLPHHLVAAFKSTLEEAIQADILLHLIDTSNPAAAEQAEITCEVLQELGAKDKPVITVLNKIDQEGSETMINRLRTLYPKTVQISAREKKGFDPLQAMMIDALKEFRQVVRLRIPQKEYGIVAEVQEHGNLLEQEYEGNDVLITVDLPAALAGKLKDYVD